MILPVGGFSVAVKKVVSNDLGIRGMWDSEVCRNLTIFDVLK